MKKKVLLSSIATIALCLCLIAGSTFALFTSTSETNIAVTAGKVEMIASVEDFKLYSVEAKADGTIVDENGGKYEYVERTDGKFINGGTAVLDGSMITLDKITPGDKISFGINGANNSDVSIQCRYIIQCAGDEALMKGLLVYINGVAYPALKSYTSAWTALEVGKSITDEKNIEIVVELPIKAGNEYQEKTTSINVLVEAVQGNADVDGSQATAQFLNGRVDLSDLTVTDTVANYGNVELVGGTVDVDDCGFENYGEATLTDMTLTAGSASDYGFRGIGSDSVTVLNDVEFVSGGGAIGAANGAEVTVNSGTYHVDSASTSGRYLIYTEGEGTKVVVNGGTYSWDKADNQKRAYVYAGVGTTVEINGGTFGKASTRSGYTAGILGDGSVIITGGTFGFDPSAWVATGYQAIKNDSIWYVVPEVVDSVATSAEELSSALENGEDNIVVMNATFTENNLNGRYYKDRNIDFVNCTFQTNMNYMYINNATFTNCVFDCGSDNSAVHYDELFGDLVFNNCTFISGKIQIGARVENEVILGTVTFNDCEFAETATTSIWAEKGVRVYSPATFNNCEFNNRVVLAGSNGLAVNFNGCTMEGGKPVYYIDNTDGIIRGGNVPVVTVNQ